MSCHAWDSKTENQTHQIPCNKTLLFLVCLVSKPHGTQWLEDLFHGKQATFPLQISTFNSSELTPPPFVEPCHPNKPPIPGPSKSSKPHEDIPTCAPEPEVALTQSLEEPFG
ncbi:hypothetical protein O181_030831 [Austropuccinia psidii MF-1]|uniref:Uncharacterized protein n=1 Tax=Austropuccinia psidii MF-1 TaxID=1389203 RepID=A0A9Q3CTP6_9BASI|nr:hypothetical protein [Austropuccinia psidii MF-1]